MLTRGLTTTSGNADIERELFHLGLRDSPPPIHPPTDTASQPLPFSVQDFLRTSVGFSRTHPERRNDLLFARSLDIDEIRSSSAPAVPFERQLSHPDDLLFLAAGFDRGTGTRSLNDVEPCRPRSSSHGASNHHRNHVVRGFRPLVSAAPSSSVWQDPRAVHYPGHVQLQDFLTLPRGAYEDEDELGLAADDEAELDAIEQELVACVEAALRRVHAGIQESHIRYDHPDSVAEPPPPQPVGATLRDPPPSPEPPHNHYSPPRPSFNGMPGGQHMQEPRNGRVYRTMSGPSHYGPGIGSPPRETHRRSSMGVRLSGCLRGPPLLIDPVNASFLSQQLGFVPIRNPPSTQYVVKEAHSHHHHHHHHSHHKRHEETHTTQAHLFHHHHFHHERKKSSKALRRIRNVAAIARGSGIKILKIRRVPHPGPGYGFSIKGSLERGLGVYVSRVEERGPAWTAGLRPGDLLLAANNDPVSQMNHTEIIALLQSSEEISLTVAATSQLSAPVVVSQSYSWMTPDSKPVSPPAEYNPRLHRRQVSTVDVDLEGCSHGLGLMIRGGAEYGLGIYITGVDPGSAAQKAGLKVGDQILEVNGESFLAVTHDTAVSVLKHSRHLEMSIRRIAKVPHSCTTYHRTRSTKARRMLSSEGHASENLDATLAMIEEKSKSVLVPYEHSRLSETVTNYAGGRVPISRLLMVAEKVLNTPEKLSLLTELREVVRIADLNEFDATVFNRSSNLSIKKSPFLSEDINSPGDIDSINRMVRSLQLSLDDDNVPENTADNDEKLLEESTKTQNEGINNIGSKKKRKGVTRQKERKRNKTVIENGNRLVDQNIFNNGEIALLKSSNSKFKTNLKSRKSLKKRLSEKSLISKEDITTDYQDPTSSHQHRHCPSSEESAFLALESTSQAQLLNSQLQEGLSLPSLSSYNFLEEATSQPLYFSHSFSAVSLHQPSFDTSFKDKGAKMQQSPSYSSPASKTISPPPLFSPTFPESDVNSPIFSPCVPSCTHSSSALYPSDISGKLQTTDHFRGGNPPKVSLPYEAFTSQGRQVPQVSEDQYTYVNRSFVDPFSYFPDRSSDFRNNRSDFLPHPNYREQLDFRENIATSRIVDDQSLREERDFRNRRGREAAQMSEFGGSLRDSEFGNNKRRPKELNLIRDPRLMMEYADPRGYSQSQDVFYSQAPSREQDPFENLTRSAEDPRFIEHYQMCQSCELIANKSSHIPKGLQMYTCPHQRVGRRSPLVISDSQGRVHVIVKKTKTNLGIAIEGGVDTKHPLPRVINIAANGAAFEGGGLRVGQIILEVDGHKLEGKSHDEVAHIIANSWTDRAKSELEFVVKDKRSTEADLRRSSLLSQTS